MEGVKEDMLRLGVKNWKEKAEDRNEWKMFLKKFEAMGLVGL